MTGEKAEFHQASCDVIGKVKAIKRPGFTFLEMGEGLGRNWGISPVCLPVDTQLHRGISIRTVVEHVKFPELSPEACPTLIIPDHFGPRYRIRQEYF
jgi:hypothetical protein